MDENIVTCRICLENDSIINMIFPCLCSGTSKYVHKKCLNQWRTISDNEEAYSKCFECNYKYLIINTELGKPPTISRRFLKYLSSHLFLFLALNNIAILFIWSILDNVVNERKLLQLFAFETAFEGYLVISFCVYIVSIFFIFIINLCTLNINKKQYIYYYFSRNVYNVILSILLITGLLLIEPIFAMMVISIFIQIILRTHYMVIAKINKENSLEIINYDSIESCER